MYVCMYVLLHHMPFLSARRESLKCFSPQVCATTLISHIVTSVANNQMAVIK